MNYKIKFRNQAHAEEIQNELLSMGLVYDIGKQEVRKCYGLMVKDGNIYTAGNKYAFNAYGSPKVRIIPADKPKPVFKPKEPPKPKADYKVSTIPGRTAYQARIEAEKSKLVFIIQDVLAGMKNQIPNLFGTNTKSYARRCTWERVLVACLEKYGGKFSENTWRNAARVVLDTYGMVYSIPGSRIIRDTIKAAE
jgi:hypothetical protein